jgi:phosphatidylserine synthase
MFDVMTSPAVAVRLRNTVTYAGLGLGLAAMAAAGRGHQGSAGALVALAVIADTFDGRFARRFSRRDGREDASIGAELDSLCDACTFGVAPVICTVIANTGVPSGPALWVAGGLYVASAVTRLAFYNATHMTTPGFIGLPVPVAALVWSSALCVTRQPLALAAVLVVAAAAMVAPWRIARPTGAGLAAFVLWPVFVGLVHFAYP